MLVRDISRDQKAIVGGEMFQWKLKFEIKVLAGRRRNLKNFWPNFS